MISLQLFYEENSDLFVYARNHEQEHYYSPVFSRYH
jgi:hypothetical protein